MSSDDDVEFDYAYLTQHALRGVVRDVLATTAELGDPPGEHHFYIEFATGARGVDISAALRAQYPERMTIVLQHQFDDLEVYPDHFEVTLHFKGIPNRLIIPFDAVTQFADPSVNFALQFPFDEALLASEPSPVEQPAQGPSGEIETLDAHRRKDTARTDDDDGPDDEGPGPGGSADVVSIDRFRKK